MVACLMTVFSAPMAASMPMAGPSMSMWTRLLSVWLLNAMPVAKRRMTTFLISVRGQPAVLTAGSASAILPIIGETRARNHRRVAARAIDAGFAGENAVEHLQPFVRPGPGVVEVAGQKLHVAERGPLPVDRRLAVRLDQRQGAGCRSAPTEYTLTFFFPGGDWAWP